MSLRLLLLLAVAPVATGLAESTPSLPAPKAAKIFGQAISYYDVGSGSTVVLVHGLGSSARGDWGNVIMPLAAHHRVLAMDQLGFGHSDKPLIDYRIQTWVDFLGEFLRRQNITDFALVGESLGGWVSAQYSIQALKGTTGAGPFALPKPNRLVLCDAAGHAPRASSGPLPAGPMDTASLEGCRNLCSAIFFDPSYHSDEAVRAFFEGSLATGAGYTSHVVFSNPALAQERVEGKLGAISVPTLVIWGDHDLLVPLEDGKDYAAHITGARLEIIPNAGHAACIEQATAFLAVLSPFLDAPDR